MKVKEQLKHIDKGQKVNCVFYAYGIFWASSLNDGMVTAGDCLDRLNTTCLNAKVSRINPSDADPERLVIHAEVVS